LIRDAFAEPEMTRADQMILYMIDYFTSCTIAYTKINPNMKLGAILSPVG
jgi:hypothetical protein